MTGFDHVQMVHKMHPQYSNHKNASNIILTFKNEFEGIHNTNLLLTIFLFILKVTSQNLRGETMTHISLTSLLQFEGEGF